MLWTCLLCVAQACATTRSILPPVRDPTPNEYTTEATIQQGPEYLNPYPYKPKVHFRPDGSFKLLVMSDLHFGENPWDAWGPDQDKNSIALIRKVLGEETPDYVVIDGDLITGENTFKENSTRLIDQIVKPLVDLSIPFSSVHGNHDNQPNISHFMEIQREMLVAPNSYTRLAPPGVGGEGGQGNYWVPVYRSPSDNKPILVLWFFDSRGGKSLGNATTTHNIDDWVDVSVADWIEKETSFMEQYWGPSSSRGALAFVHIPPYRVRVAQATLNNTVSPGLNEDAMGDGSSQAQGKDEPFWSALRSIPNLHALVSGHDHGNEWCKRIDSVVYCFAKHSGYGGYGQKWWGFGVRNLVFKQFNSIGSVDTWIRLENGTKRGILTLDENFDPVHTTLT